MGRTSRKRCKKKKMFLDVIENEGQILTHLKSWMLRHSTLFISHLVAENFNVTGRGLKTLKDIQSGDVLIRIPLDLLITTNTVAESPIKILFLDNEYYNAQFVLSVFLMYESHLGQDSKWLYYLLSLPKSFTNVDFCTEREKSLLPGFVSEYFQKVHKLKSDYCLILKSLDILTLEKKDQCPHCNISLKEILTFNKFKWAYYVVNTRGVYLKVQSSDINTININGVNNMALAPFLDLFNHDLSASVSVPVLANIETRKFYEIVTLKPFQKDSQVFINYGSHNSLKLYVEYGFFISNNPLDEIYFNIDEITETCVNIPKLKLDFIKSNALDENMAFSREGLNYNAIYTLFIVSSELTKDSWCKKIYGSLLTSQELHNIYNLGKRIANRKQQIFQRYLFHMKQRKHHSQSFSVAIRLMEEYCTLLADSISCLHI